MTTSLLQSSIPGVRPSDAAAELLRRRQARSSLLAFTLYTMLTYEVSWHHRRLCTFLDRFARGEIKRGIINMPPQHGKSELASRRLPAYLLGLNPDLRVIAASHTADLAGAMNKDVQRIIDDGPYRSLFPATTLNSKNNRTDAHGGYLRNSDMFEVVGHRGYYKSAGVGGAIVGRGFDVGIIDDPIRGREQADSPAVRENVWKWYTGDFYTRRGKGARILVIMTRWHPEDLAGRLLTVAADSRADQWEVLTLPAIAEQEIAGDPRKPGEALWPERYPLDDLDKIKVANPTDWFSQYQQHPRPEGGVEWPDEYFGPAVWFDEWPKDLYVKAIATDPSKGKSDKVGDYSAHVWGGLDSATNTLWVDADLQRRHTGKIIEDGIGIYLSFHPQAWALEINAYQELLGTEILRVAGERRLTLAMYGITNTVPKPIRIRTVGPYLGQRRLRIRNSPGGRMLVQQLKDFPCGAHDDGPDALEMLLRMLGHLLGDEHDQAPEILRP